MSNNKQITKIQKLELKSIQAMYIYTENHALQVNTIIAPKRPHSIVVF